MPCKCCGDELEVLWAGDKFAIVCTGCMTEFLREDGTGGGLYMDSLGYRFYAETVTAGQWAGLMDELVEPSRSCKNDISIRPGCPQCGTAASLNAIFLDDDDEPSFALCDMCHAELVPPGGTHCLGGMVVGVGQDVWDSMLDVFRDMVKFDAVDGEVA